MALTAGGIDGRAVASGAGVALLIGVPMAVVAEAVAGSTDDTPGWVGLLGVVVMVGFAAGGYVAATKQPDAPFTHGALAALSAFALVQLLGVVLIASRGDELRPVAYVFNALLASVLGVIGGALAERRAGDSRVTVLVVDVGTSGVRAAIVRPDASVEHVHYREVLPSSPAPGFVEFDAAAMAAAALDVAAAAIAAGGPVTAVGITNQRASTIVWDRATGEPVGPGIGWQDLRTAGMCLMLREQGLRLAPNVSATKLAFLLDAHDPQHERDLAFGTVDSWIAWQLSGGTAHVTDLSNAAVTGLVHNDGSGWDRNVLAALRIPESVLPAIVDSAGVCADASALDGSPPIAGIAGDQQASLIGQGCVHPGLAKITFGTGGMLDTVVGAERPGFDTRGGSGTFPIVAWRRAGVATWGLEAVMLSAGTNVEWLRDDLGIIATSAESHDVAAQCDTTDGVLYVPALLGLGTPYWDYGARGTLLGVTRGTTRAHVVRAVLEGVAQRGADLVEAAETDSGLAIESLRIDGGMTANPTFVQALADATGRAIEVSPQTEATTLGAGFLAGLATGVWADDAEVAAAWDPKAVIEPRRRVDRERWREACRRAGGWVPELSALEF